MRSSLLVLLYSCDRLANRPGDVLEVTELASDTYTIPAAGASNALRDRKRIDTRFFTFYQIELTEIRFCPERVMYGTDDFHLGSFASHTVWREAYLFKIPDSISMEHAGPLQCGGATVFNALEKYGTRPTDRVGIIGVGGLGHLAIQFASKMGCQVVVFSGTDSKKEEAMKLGAVEFHATKGLKELKMSKPINRLLVTTSQQPDWAMYQSILAPNATIFPLSVAGGNLEIPYMPLIESGTRIQGTIVAARAIHMKMLEFAADHDIKPIIESFPLTKEGIEKAFERLDHGKMRYRGVLVAQD